MSSCRVEQGILRDNDKKRQENEDDDTKNDKPITTDKPQHGDKLSTCDKLDMTDKHQLADMPRGSKHCIAKMHEETSGCKKTDKLGIIDVKTKFDKLNYDKPSNRK